MPGIPADPLRSCGTPPAYDSPMGSSDSLTLLRRPLRTAHPWQLPEGVVAAPLSRSGDGSAPRLATSVAAFHDGSTLFVVFRCDDAGVSATLTERDAALYTEDVVEIFLAPRALETYFEIEVNPLGTLFDARIESPEGVRETMKTDLGWECEGLWAAIRREIGRDGSSVAETAIAIPFASLDVAPPAPGDVWAANFFRIDRSSEGDEYSAWRPTGRTPPDFHVPAAFGRLVFD
jgi:hypothetical protein